VISVGTTAFIVQLGSMYVFTAVMKTDGVWRHSFDAAYYSIGYDQYTTETGYRMMEHPELLRLSTAATLALEFIGPLLLLIPIGNAKFRIMAIAGFIGLHLGLSACLNLGLFSWICICSWLALLPSCVWDRMQPKPQVAPRWIGTSLSNALAAALLALVVVLNVARLHASPYAAVMPQPFEALLRAIGLDQHWCMFSPSPPRFGGWLIIEGQLADGSTVDLWHPENGDLRAEPPLVSAEFASVPWRRCLVTLLESPEPAHAKGVADYFRRRWDESHSPGRRVESLTMVFMLRPTAAPGRPPQPAIPVELYRWPNKGRGEPGASAYINSG